MILTLRNKAGNHAKMNLLVRTKNGKEFSVTVELNHINVESGVKLEIEMSDKRRIIMQEQAHNGLHGILGIIVQHLNQAGEVITEEEPGIL